MAVGSEELERIGRALPPETLTELSRLTTAITPEAFSAVLGMIRSLPPGALDHLAHVELRTPELPWLELSVMQRAMRAVTASFDAFDQEKLSELAAGETDAEVLLGLASSSLLVEALEEKDPLAGARLRGIEEQMRLLDEAGGALGATEAGEILGGISRQAVDARRKKGRLLAVATGRHGWRYPRCQFAPEGTRDKVVRGLDKVLAAIEDDLGGWMRLAFLLSPEERLGGRRPLDLLKESGEVDAVERAARLYGEHVAY